MFRESSLAPFFGSIVGGNITATKTIVYNNGKSYELETGPFAINPSNGLYLVEDHGKTYRVQPKFFWAYFVLLILSVGMGGILIILGVYFHITGDMRYE